MLPVPSSPDKRGCSIGMYGKFPELKLLVGNPLVGGLDTGIEKHGAKGAAKRSKDRSLTNRSSCRAR